MKRIVFLVLLSAVTWQVQAQRPLIMSGSPGYMFMPPPTEDSVQLQYVTGPNVGCSVIGCDFRGNAFRPGHPVTVYGVALIAEYIERYPYLWVYLMYDHVADSDNMCYDLDTVAAELFCFIEDPPVSYADFGFGRTDTTVLPFYEFYFSEPIEVPAGRRFFLGVSHSPYNVWNQMVKGRPYNPRLFYNAPRFRSAKWAHNVPQDPTCVLGDGLDSTWSIDKYYFPGLIDWACNRCRTPLPNPEANPYYNKYVGLGFTAIVRPPEDSSRIHPPHEHPLRAGAVTGFRLTGLDSAHATFAWDTLEPSDWGAVGVNADAYQVNYAPYMQEYAEGDTLMARGDSCTLRMAFDSTVMYKARCRVRSHHVCDIHDTVVWGDWSEEVYFHTGVGVPDTVPLECCHVDSLRFAGLVGEQPRFVWERCEGADRYETQYAVVGGDGWHRGATTALTDYILRAEMAPGRRYMVRVRSLCDHHCHIHDTVLGGDWSDTVFYPQQTEGVGMAVEGAVPFGLVPNPARGTVTVESEGVAATGGGTVTVTDAAGKTVLRAAVVSDRQRLDVADLPAGTYFVTLTTAEGTSTQRLVIK